VHFMQQWFCLSDPTMEEAFFETPPYREFAQLDAHGRLPDESTILRSRHRMEKHELARADVGHGQRIARREGLAA
jgi:transposase, IS5 family